MNKTGSSKNDNRSRGPGTMMCLKKERGRERGRGKKHEGARINESREGAGSEESLVFICFQHCSKSEEAWVNGVSG